MSRNNKLLLIFAVAVFVPVITIWWTVWPILRPWNLPDVAAGTLVQAGQERALAESDIVAINQWLHTNRTAWGVSGEVPPGQADRLFKMKSGDGRVLLLSTWHFRHGADVAGIQTHEQGPYRMRSFDRGTLHLPSIP